MLLNMQTRYFILSALAERVVSFALPQQEVLTSLPVKKDPNVILSALRHAEIVPDVLNTFSPLISLSVNWSSSDRTNLGNTIPPSHLQHSPDVHINTIPSAYLPFNTQLVLALTDPDAPSHEDPKWSQVCHWLVTAKSGRVKELVEYKPPGPPEGTGKHRYVFVVMIAKNGTTESLKLTVPEERRHWGYDGKRSGVREYAKENGLKVIGANFIYAQNDKQ
ncbi:PEBP-like protein [Aureobasidium subglaciale]|nr:PEBP-like protein [Aureobasidium subglaciale]